MSESLLPFDTLLTPAQHERLALLAEEMGEALQAIGKVLRHGYESVNPLEDMSPTNRCNLEKELGDVRFAMIFLCESGDLSKDAIHGWADLKREKVKPWLHYSEPIPQCSAESQIGNRCVRPRGHGGQCFMKATEQPKDAPPESSVPCGACGHAHHLIDAKIGSCWKCECSGVEFKRPEEPVFMFEFRADETNVQAVERAMREGFDIGRRTVQANDPVTVAHGEGASATFHPLGAPCGVCQTPLHIPQEAFEKMALEQSRRYRLQDVENGIDCMADSPDDFHIVPAREHVRALLAAAGITVDAVP